MIACGKKDYLENYEPPEIVAGDLETGSNVVYLTLADNHGLNHHMDSDIDVVVQQWDEDKELYTANPLKNRKKLQVRYIYPMDKPIDSSSIKLTIDLDGYTKARSRHHIWVRHEKGVELERPALDG